MKLSVPDRPRFVSDASVYCRDRGEDVRLEDCLACEWLRHVSTGPGAAPVAIECDSPARPPRPHAWALPIQ